MKIDSVSLSSYNITSQAARKRYLTSTTQFAIFDLLKKMNNETVYKENSAKTNFTSKILASISIGDKIKFTDDRYYLSQVIEDKADYPYDCTLKMGKTVLNINSKTGEIVRNKKGPFTFWCSVYSAAEECINKLLNNYENPDVVKKSTLGICGLTQKGLKILRAAQERA